MASIHYWDQHNKEIHASVKKLFPGQRYHLLDDKQERKVKREAAKMIKMSNLKPIKLKGAKKI